MVVYNDNSISMIWNIFILVQMIIIGRLNILVLRWCNYVGLYGDKRKLCIQGNDSTLCKVVDAFATTYKLVAKDEIFKYGFLR